MMGKRKTARALRRLLFRTVCFWGICIAALRVEADLAPEAQLTQTAHTSEAQLTQATDLAPEADSEVHLDIDTDHAYASMNTSYAQGYIPVIQNDRVFLVVPFVADGPLQNDRLTVELIMGENAPFVYANYRKNVKKETYLFEKSVDAYVFACAIDLEPQRINGKYPVLVRAVGYSESGRKTELACRIYITISDGRNPGSSTQDPSAQPTQDPSVQPTQDPSVQPTQDPSAQPTQDPSVQPTQDPSARPTQDPSVQPTQDPSVQPTQDPSVQPMQDPSDRPTQDPSVQPMQDPSVQPTQDPSVQPTQDPSVQPTGEPDMDELYPDGLPTDEPSAGEPSTEEPATEMPAELGSFSGGSYGGYTDGGSGGETEKIHRQPRLMLLAGGIPEEPLLAGQRMELNLSMQNMNENEAIYNLKISVKPAAEQISLSTSSFYFGKVYPKETITLPTAVSAAANAPAGRMPVTISYEYENEKGTAYSGTEEIVLDICQSVQVSLEGFQLPAQVYSMETIESGVQIRNVGKTMIYNAQVEFQGEGLFATGTVFAGNLDAGTAGEGTLRIYVGNKNMTALSDAGAGTDDSAYGPASGTLTLTYEDAYGEKYSQTQEFSTVIQKPQTIELTVEKEEVQTNQWWAASLVLLVLLFLVILIGMALRLRKSRRALEDLLAAGK